jgi:hypothetical protein
VLKKGESSKINVTIDTKGKSGKIIKNVTVISNDPNNSFIQINITGTVEKAEEPTPQNQPTPGQTH